MTERRRNVHEMRRKEQQQQQQQQQQQHHHILNSSSSSSIMKPRNPTFYRTATTLLITLSSLLITPNSSFTIPTTTTTCRHPQLKNSHNKMPSSSSSPLKTSNNPTAATETSTLAPHLPSLPLPPPILSLTPGTWSHDTMSRRVNDDILQRTLDENPDFLTPPYSQIYQSFLSLRNELSHAAETPLRHLLSSSDDDGDNNDADDETEWREILSPHVATSSTWLSTPWLVAEFYLYRRLLEATGYFIPSSIGYRLDPFSKQKRSGLRSSPPAAEGVLSKVDGIMDTYTLESLGILTSVALWGNQMDLSIWPSGMTEDRENVLLMNVMKSNHENLLWDDTERLKGYCDTIMEKGDDDGGGGGAIVDIIVDNAGLELVTDLIVADYLMRCGFAKRVTFRLKSHPTFVSDAMEKDLLETVRHYKDLEEGGEEQQQLEFCRAAGKRWSQYLNDGTWICKEDNFWVQPKPMWDMPPTLRNDMSQSDLAIVKGDANYRRLLGDLEWDVVADSFQNVVGDYFPCPVLALRTLKAEIGCGMVREKVEWAKGVDEEWMVNGKFGVVHFGVPPTE